MCTGEMQILQSERFQFNLTQFTIETNKRDKKCIRSWLNVAKTNRLRNEKKNRRETNAECLESAAKGRRLRRKGQTHGVSLKNFSSCQPSESTVMMEKPSAGNEARDDVNKLWSGRQQIAYTYSRVKVFYEWWDVENDRSIRDEVGVRRTCAKRPKVRESFRFARLLRETFNSTFMQWRKNETEQNSDINK